MVDRYPGFKVIKVWTVNNDVGELKAVLIHPPGLEALWSLPIAGDYPLIYRAPFNRHVLEEAVKEFEGIAQKIRENSSARIFYLKDLIRETLNDARDDERRFRKLMATIFMSDWKRMEKWLGDNWKDLDAGDILGEKMPIIKDEKGYRVGIRPKTNISNPRDLGVMTPKGLILSHKRRWMRSEEDGIIKAVVENHPVLRENIEVCVDFNTNEGCYVECGDCTIPSENSIAVAIRHLSNREAVKKLSERLEDMTIYAPNAFPLETETGFKRLFWHLDSSFVMVNDHTALCSPYIYGYPREGRKTLLRLMKIMRRDLEEWHPVLRTYREAGKEAPRWLKERIYGDLAEDKTALLNEVGSVEIYKKGELIAVKDSFVDALIDDEILEPDNIIFTGGHPDQYRNEYEYFFTAIREQIYMANCIVAVRPGVVIVYEENERTIEALRDFNIKVIPTPGGHMVEVFEMGTHCTTMPLWRERA